MARVWRKSRQRRFHMFRRPVDWLRTNRVRGAALSLLFPLLTARRAPLNVNRAAPNRGGTFYLTAPTDRGRMDGPHGMARQAADLDRDFAPDGDLFARRPRPRAGRGRVADGDDGRALPRLLLGRRGHRARPLPSTSCRSRYRAG